MYSVRLWASRHARFFEGVYNLFEPVIVRLHPLWTRVGYQRAEKPVSRVEKLCKSLLFDCKMCGQCILSSTGMSCSMNCPKNLRNGPCGGVRQNGNCEVYAERRCVWVEAWSGSQKMKQGERIHVVQQAVDFSQQGSSSWLRQVRQIEQRKQQAKESSQ